MASNKFAPQVPSCIELESLPIPHQKMGATLTIDKRCYVNKKGDDAEKRIRISIFKKDSRSVELSLDEAINLFKKGIELAEEVKNFAPYRS